MIYPDNSQRINWQHPLSKGLVGCFVPVNGVWRDFTGNFTGSLEEDNSSGDLTRNTGVFGPTTEFSGDATNDRIQIGSVPSSNKLSLFNDNTFSIIASCNPQTLGGNDFGRIIDKSDGGNGANGWVLFLGDSPRANCMRFIINNQQTTSLVSPANFVQFNVHRTYALVRLGTGTNQCRWYRDGEEQGRESYNVSFVSTTTNAAIGNWNHSTNRMFDGLIDYVMVWDCGLSEFEVLSIHLDPFQMIGEERQVFGLPFVAPPVTGNPWYHYRQQGFN